MQLEVFFLWELVKSCETFFHICLYYSEIMETTEDLRPEETTLAEAMEATIEAMEATDYEADEVIQVFLVIFRPKTNNYKI